MPCSPAPCPRLPLPAVRRRRAACGIALLLLSALLTGCAGRGAAMRVSSLTEPARIDINFDQAFYRLDQDRRLTFVLVEGPLESPRQVATLRMFWQPRAGKTPINPAATNATIHYLIFAGDRDPQVGVYSGAGFLFPHDRPGEETLTAGLWQSTLRLSDASDRFADRLGRAVMEGRIKARRDEAQVEALLRAVNVRLRQELGYPRLVKAD